MLKNYLKIAFRNFGKNKGFAGINIMGLATALAVFIIIILYVRHEMSYDTHFSTSDRLYRVLLTDAEGVVSYPGTPESVSWELKELYPEVIRSVKVHPPGTSEYLLEANDRQIYQDRLASASADFFYMFDYDFIHGTREHSLDEPNSLVLTNSLSGDLFDEVNPVGETVYLNNGSAYTVTGVVEDPPSSTHLPFSFVVSSQRGNMSLTWNGITGSSYILLNSVDAAGAFQQKLPDYFDAYSNYPEGTVLGERGFLLQPVTDVHLYPLGQDNKSSRVIFLTIFLVVAFLILVIACLNYINLSTAQSLERVEEIGVRKASGATRSQIMSQVLIETTVLCTIAFVLSLWMVELALPWVQTVFDVNLAALNWLTPQWLMVLGGTLLMVVIFSGAYCAFFISSLAPEQLFRGNNPLNVTSSGSLRKGLVVVQFAGSLTVVIATILVLQQMEFVKDSRLDGHDSRILVIKNDQAEEITTNFEAFRQELARQPAITNVAAGHMIDEYSLFVPDRHESGEESTVYYLSSTSNYLQTLGINLRSGRYFDQDAMTTTGTHTEFIINETAARWFGIEEANGQEIELGSLISGSVIGIIDDYHHRSLYEPIMPMVIGTADPYDSGIFMKRIFVQLEEGRLSEGLQQVSEVWESFQTGVPMNYTFLDEELDSMYKLELQMSRIFRGFSLFSIFIACLGLFGLAAYSVKSRTKEIGIRKVLGATLTHIVTLLSKDFLFLVGIGFLLALPIAWFGVQQWMQDFAYRVDVNPLLFIETGLFVLILTLITVSWQSIRAAVANPVESLRSE